MKLFIVVLFIFYSSLGFTETKGSEFKGKYLFTHWSNYKIKEYNDVFSKCFKLNNVSLDILQSYDSCTKADLQNIPFGIGKCERKDGATAYFFDTLENCNGAREDLIEGSAS